MGSARAKAAPLRVEILLRRARERCRRHRQAPGVRRACLVVEAEGLGLEENPTLSRGDAFDVVQEWLAGLECEQYVAWGDIGRARHRSTRG